MRNPVQRNRTLNRYTVLLVLIVVTSAGIVALTCAESSLNSTHPGSAASLSADNQGFVQNRDVNTTNPGSESDSDQNSSLGFREPWSNASTSSAREEWKVTPPKSDLCNKMRDPVTKELIRDLIQSGREADAQASLTRLIETYPINPCLYQVKGDLLFNTSPATALISYAQAAIYGSEDPAMYEKMGDIEHRLGSYEEAMGSYQMALSFIPDDPVLLEKQGNLFSERGMYKQAIDSYDHALSGDITPEKTKTLRLLMIELLRKSGRYGEAMLELDRLNATRPVPQPLTISPDRERPLPDDTGMVSPVNLTPTVSQTTSPQKQENYSLIVESGTPIPEITVIPTKSESDLPPVEKGMNLTLLIIPAGIILLGILGFLSLRTVIVSKKISLENPNGARWGHQARRMKSVFMQNFRYLEKWRRK